MINQIILSCNEDPIYREFWPLVAKAYRTLLPRITVHLAFLTDRYEDDQMVTEMRRHGRVTLFRILPDIPEFGQAKMIRFILASEQMGDVCYIDDIDLIPLNDEFIITKVAQRPANVLLCVGGEVYGWNGCYPVSQMTAEGHVWKRFINPLGLTTPDLLRSWKDHVFYDNRENIMIKPVKDEATGGFVNDHYFSDERLLKRLLVDNPVPKLELKRGYDNFLDCTIDRATVDSKTGIWKWDVEKLRRGEYVNVHGARAVSQFEADYKMIMDYLGSGQ